MYGNRETYNRATRVLSTETCELLNAGHVVEDDSDMQLVLAAIAVGAMARRDRRIVLVLLRLCLRTLEALGTPFLRSRPAMVDEQDISTSFLITSWSCDGRDEELTKLWILQSVFIVLWSSNRLLRRPLDAVSCSADPLPPLPCCFVPGKTNFAFAALTKN